MNEVRILQIGQKDTYEAGSWAHHGHLYPLEIGDTLQAVSEFTDATDETRVITNGTQCIFRGYDHEGDVLIELDTQSGIANQTVIFFEDLRNLSLM